MCVVIEGPELTSESVDFDNTVDIFKEIKKHHILL